MEHSQMKHYRERAHLTVAQLAELAHVDETNINRAETGKAVPKVKAEAIATALSNTLRQPLTPKDLDIQVEQQ